MEITKIVKGECTDTEYVFETKPALTQEVMDEYNRRDHDESRHLTQRNGKLVITRKQIRAMQDTQWSKKPAQVLSGFLTEAEEQLKRDAATKAQALDSRTAETAGFFGVPVG